MNNKMKGRIIMNHTEYLELCATIDYHMNRYYNLDDPEISDYEYDQLMSKLKIVEKEHPEWVTDDSPTRKIGGVAKREAGVKVTHDVPMLSIEDVFSLDDVKAWVQKVKEVYPDATFSVEPKIDGLSATLRYEKKPDGKMHLIMCETRGDGHIGEDVTVNAMVINSVPQVIDAPYESLQIRGEVYMTHENFDKYNEIQSKNGKKLAANPRNLAAGTLRQLDPAITKERGLDMLIFNIQSGPDELMQSHVQGLNVLESYGVPVIPRKLCSTVDEIITEIANIAERRSQYHHDIDGAVVKLDNIAHRGDFGGSSKYSSGHIAYKYPPEMRVIVMDNIIVDVGRTGKMTFTGVFHDKETGTPARLCGTNVSRVTLHNQDYIEMMSIGVGGSYTLYKSGEIIPKLNSCVEKPAAVFKAPDKCPVCGESLIREGDSADIMCINPNCPAQLTRTIAYFTSRDCMNIMGLGDTLVDALVAGGYLSDYADLYALKNFRDALVQDGSIGREKSVDKLLKAIEDSKQNNPVNLLTGLAIRNVGKHAAKELMKKFDSITALSKATMEELVGIDDIGEITAQCIVNFFNNETNKAMLKRLQEYGVNMNMPKDSDSSNKLAGMTIVVTGTLPTLGRKEATELIEKNGGKCSGSVSKKTTMVLAGEAAGSKLTKAQELGIKIITEAEFLEMIS